MESSTFKGLMQSIAVVLARFRDSSNVVAQPDIYMHAEELLDYPKM